MKRRMRDRHILVSELENRYEKTKGGAEIWENRKDYIFKRYEGERITHFLIINNNNI